MEDMLNKGSATFGIYDKNLEHRYDDPFICWLKSEGFKAQRYGYPSSDHFLYINVNSKVFNWGMRGASLSPILFDHTLHIDEFKQIYAIYKKYEGLATCCYSEEEQRAFEDRMMVLEEHRDKTRQSRLSYFADNPSFRKWCSDIKHIILKDPYLSEEYDKEMIESDMEKYHDELHERYTKLESPAFVAAHWSGLRL